MLTRHVQGMGYKEGMRRIQTISSIGTLTTVTTVTTLITLTTNFRKIAAKLSKITVCNKVTFGKMEHHFYCH